MTRIIRRKSGDPVYPESIERLKHLAELPDESINTSDIPEWTPEQFASARARRELRMVRSTPELQKKAS